jgi:hypothetical protein
VGEPPVLRALAAELWRFLAHTRGRRALAVRHDAARTIAALLGRRARVETATAHRRSAPASAPARDLWRRRRLWGRRQMRRRGGGH